jgi:DNA-binding phage protein
VVSKSTQSIEAVVAALTSQARGRGLSDAKWAAAAGVRKETLSRLRSRTSCDYATLEALASALGLTISIAAPASRALSSDQHFPQRIDREYEEHLLTLCASGDLERGAWCALGPAFFMAGLAVMLASVSGFDRRRLLALAEGLHPGSSLPEVFAIWLARSALRPSRFLPMLLARTRRAA